MCLKLIKRRFAEFFCLFFFFLFGKKKKEIPEYSRLAALLSAVFCQRGGVFSALPEGKHVTGKERHITHSLIPTLFFFFFFFSPDVHGSQSGSLQSAAPLLVNTRGREPLQISPYFCQLSFIRSVLSLFFRGSMLGHASSLSV